MRFSESTCLAKIRRAWSCPSRATSGGSIASAFATQPTISDPPASQGLQSHTAFTGTDAATAFSILVLTETTMPSGFFPKKKPPRTIIKWQHVNRKRSRVRTSSWQLRSGVSPVPKSGGPGAPSVWFLGRRDRGHPPSARKQSEFLNCDLWPNLEMRYIRKEEHSNPIKLADL